MFDTDAVRLKIQCKTVDAEAEREEIDVYRGLIEHKPVGVNDLFGPICRPPWEEDLEEIWITGIFTLEALMYPLLVACKSISDLLRGPAMKVVDRVRQLDSQLVDQDWKKLVAYILRNIEGYRTIT